MNKTKKTFEMNNDFEEAALMQSIDAQSVLMELLAGAGGIQEDSQEQPEPVQKNPENLAAQVDEVVRGLSGVKAAGQVYLIDVRQLEPYPEQPFKLYAHERLEELAEDIGRVGILSPILARRHKNKLQILAGHNRWVAAKLAGISQVPVLVLEADDDEAALVVTSTNLRQREKLLPSEKAFAYKMQMDALRRQGSREADGYSAAGFITRQTGDSRMQIHRYIRLTELEPGLLELLDRGRISMTPAVAVSYLPQDNQRTVFELMRDFGAGLTIARANTLKNLAESKADKALSRRELEDILLGTERRESGAVKLSWENVRKYLPDGTMREDAEDVIIEALKAWGANKNKPDEKSFSLCI